MILNYTHRKIYVPLDLSEVGARVISNVFEDLFLGRLIFGEAQPSSFKLFMFLLH